MCGGFEINDRENIAKQYSTADTITEVYSPNNPNESDLMKLPLPTP